MIKVLLLLLLPTFPYITAIHCRGQIMMSIITIHHHHHHCFSQSSSEMRVGGGFPLLTVQLYSGLNNKIKSMYQCKMYLDYNPCSPTIFFIKLPLSIYVCRFSDILLVSSAKQCEIRLHVCHESMTVLSQFCAEIIIFFIFEGKELKRENTGQAFSSSIQVHSNCHSLSQTTGNICQNNNNNDNNNLIRTIIII